jgi:hypothetical protein
MSNKKERKTMYVCKYTGFGVSGDREGKIANRVAGALKRAVVIACIVIGKKIFRTLAPSLIPSMSL